MTYTAISGSSAYTGTWMANQENTANQLRFIVLNETSSLEKGYAELSGYIEIYFSDLESNADKEPYTIKITKNDDPDLGKEWNEKYGATVNDNTLHMIPNDDNVMEPSINIYDANGEEITNRFSKQFFIETKPINKDLIDDEGTGSQLRRMDGNITSGNKLGEFTIVLRAFPRENYVGRYNNVSVRYTAKVEQPLPSMMRTEPAVGEYNCASGVPTSKPAYEVLDPRGNNVASYYSPYPKSDYIISDDANTATITPDATGSKAIKWTFVPNSTSSVYPEFTKEGTINVHPQDEVGAKVQFYIYVQDENGNKVGTRQTNLGITSVSGNVYFDTNFIYHIIDQWGNNIDGFYPSPLASTSMAYMPTAQCEDESKRNYGVGGSRTGDGYYFYTRDGGAAYYYLTVAFNSTANTDATRATGVFTAIVGDTLAVPSLPTLTLYKGQKLSDVKSFNREDYFSYQQVSTGSNLGVQIIGPSDASGSGTEYCLHLTIYKKGDDGSWQELYDTQKSNNSDNTSLTLSDFSTPAVPSSRSRSASEKYLHSLDWDLTANATGNYKVVYHLYPLEYTGVWIFASWQWRTSVNDKDVVQYINVVDKVKPTIQLSNNNFVLLSGKTFAKPDVKVVTPSGRDITSLCSFSYSSSNSSIQIGSDGSLSNTSFSSNQQATITVGATVDESVSSIYENPDATTYTLNIIHEEWDYDILADATLPASPADGNYNKLVFKNTTTGAASSPYTAGTRYMESLACGITIRAIPGLAFTIGKHEEGALNTFDLDYTERTITEDGTTYPLLSLNGPQVTFGDNGVPANGIFFKLQPSVNGFVTVDAKWLKSNTYLITTLGADGNAKIVSSYVPADDTEGEHTFATPLMAGETYYLFNAGYEGESHALQLSGVEYQPAFVWSDLDIQPVSVATAYLTEDGDEKFAHTEGLPSIITETTTGVTLAVSDKVYLHHADGTDTETQYTSEDGSVTRTENFASIAQDGTVTLVYKTTDDITSGNDNSHLVPRVKVSATVSSPEMSGIESTAKYYMRICGWLAYMVPDGYAPNIRETHTIHVGTTPAVTMTWGGWKERDQITYTIQNSWMGATLENHNFDTTVDGMKRQSHMDGNNNPTDELAATFNEHGLSADGTTERLLRYQVPCRGDYVTFKPHLSGKLFVYTYQPGVVQWDALAAVDATSDRAKWVWNPTFIVDENGKGVSNVSTLTASDLRSTLSVLGDAYTGKSFYGTNPEITFNTKGSQLTSAQFNFVTSNATGWDADTKTNTTQPVMKLDDYYGTELTNTGGYLIPYSGYVRYSFDVYPGKTYYLFTQDGKLGVAGFVFSPTAMNKTALELDPSQSFDPESTHGSYEEVKLAKKFYQKQWNSVVLPFALNEDQIRETFGYGTEITTLDNVTVDDKGDVNIGFVEHYYQHMVAGVPYFIYPTFKDEAGNDIYDSSVFTTNNKGQTYLTTLTFRNVAIVKGDDALKTDVKATTTDHNGKPYTLRMVGNYTKGTRNLPANSYMMSGGKLYRTRVALSAGAYTSWIEVDGDNLKQNAKMSVFDFKGNELTDIGGNATEINAIEAGGSMQRSAADGVYNLMGQRMDGNTRLLPRGVYIISGRKVIINH